MSYVLEPYDEALLHILRKGQRRKNRTGVDTISVLSLRSVYEIDVHFPLVTKRKMYPRAVFAELIWMLSGSTYNPDLQKLGANFWTPWVDPKHKENQLFYEKTGLPPGYLGPVYGWQMRHFGGDYCKVIANEEGADFGFDQISWLVDEIKKNPLSRRLLVSMWNPKDLHIARLPPCHYIFHVDIDNEGRMSLILNQRSCDFPIGVPANIQFYSALCYMLAQQTGYKPYRFVHHTEDSHIYVNQIDQVEEYLSRPEVRSPTLELNKAKDIFSYQVDDFKIMDYHCLSPINIPVAV